MVTSIQDAVMHLITNPLGRVVSAFLAAIVFSVGLLVVPGVTVVQTASLATLLALVLTVVGETASFVSHRFRQVPHLGAGLSIATFGTLVVLNRLGHTVGLGDVVVGLTVSSLVILVGSDSDSLPSWVHSVVGWVVGGGLLVAAVSLVGFPLGVWACVVVVAGAVVALVLLDRGTSLVLSLLAGVLTTSFIIAVLGTQLGLVVPSTGSLVQVINFDGLRFNSVGGVWALVFVLALVVVSDHLFGLYDIDGVVTNTVGLGATVVAVLLLVALVVTSVISAFAVLAVAPVLAVVGVLAINRS